MLVQLFNEGLGHETLLKEVGDLLGVVFGDPGMAEDLSLPVDEVDVGRGEFAEEFGQLVVIGLRPLPAALQGPAHLARLFKKILQSGIFIQKM